MGDELVKEDLRQQILKLVQQRRRPADIARELGVTSNTVIGQINRMRRNPQKYLGLEPVKTRYVPTVAKPILPPLKKTRYIVPPGTPRLISLRDHNDAQCKMVENGYWCSALREEGSQYCNYHRRGMYQPARKNA
jgi:hypothetical protein